MDKTRNLQCQSPEKETARSGSASNQSNHSGCMGNMGNARQRPNDENTEQKLSSTPSWMARQGTSGSGRDLKTLVVLQGQGQILEEFKSVYKSESISHSGNFVV